MMWSFALVVCFLVHCAAATRERYTRGPRPCDIYAAAKTPCVAAHSTTRALYAQYTGPLYRLRKMILGLPQFKDIGVDENGYAHGDGHEEWCTKHGPYNETTCVIDVVYDQSPMANHLTPAPASKAHYGQPGQPPRWKDATPVKAMRDPIRLIRANPALTLTLNPNLDLTLTNPNPSPNPSPNPN